MMVCCFKDLTKPIKKDEMINQMGNIGQMGQMVWIGQVGWMGRMDRNALSCRGMDFM